MTRAFRGPIWRIVALFLSVALIAVSTVSCGTAPPAGGGGTNGGTNGGNGGGATQPITVTQPDTHTAVGVSTSGNVMAAATVEDGSAYSGSFTIQVGAGATRQAPDYGLLVVGSTGGFANDALTGVTVVLKSPAGAEVGRIANGAVQYPAGVTEFPDPPADLETQLEDFVQNQVGINPAGTIEDNFRALIDYAANPDSEAPSEAVENAMVAYWNQIEAVENAVVRGSDQADPVLLIANPADGAWAVEVSSPAGTQSYGVGGLYIRAGSDIRDVYDIEQQLPVLAGVAAAQTTDSEGCQEILNSAGMNLINDLMSFIPFPYTPRGYAIWAISAFMGMGFIVGAASPVLGILLGFLVSKAIGYAFDQYGWTDTVQTDINVWLTRWLDGSVAGVKLYVPDPPGMYNRDTQVVSAGPSRSFRVLRLVANNCGETPYASREAAGATTWAISGNTDLGQIIDTADDGSSVVVQTTSSQTTQGNFYVDCTYTKPGGTVYTSQLRCVVIFF